ncbi:hypothetical protein T07_13174 [Trichinella nelsoni]|uniref:Uncharacterized protein n=1 Tax=Trichinella nelsoni TaxID=6336 RepID=A0A0V0SAM7_9BILA|nr:hypothetical protein T07_13174 [Trichinella nelsoni]
MPLAMIGHTRLALCLGVHRNGLLFSVITVVSIRNGGVGDVEIDFIEQMLFCTADAASDAYASCFILIGECGTVLDQSNLAKTGRTSFTDNTSLQVARRTSSLVGHAAAMKLKDGICTFDAGVDLLRKWNLFIYN